jgi:hypothetical protein
MRFTVCVTLALAIPLLAADQLRWKDLGNGRMELNEGGKTAFIYNYGPQLKEGAPENKRRCCYVFPVYTPSGVLPVDDFPADHWHHRGVFWSWPVVETGDKRYDIWMTFTAKHRSDQVPETKVKGKEAVLVAHNVWEADGKDIVREGLQLTAYPSKNGAREFDIALTLESIKDPVTLRGSREKGKSYGGVSARFAARENTVIRADGEVLTRDEDLNPRKWAELEGVYGGKRAVLRITPDPANPGAPYQWCLRKYGFIGASFPGRTDAVDGYTLEAGKPITLKFRVRVADVP